MSVASVSAESVSAEAVSVEAVESDVSVESTRKQLRLRCEQSPESWYPDSAGTMGEVVRA